MEINMHFASRESLNKMMYPCKKFPEKIQYQDKKTAIQEAKKLNILPDHEYKVIPYKCSFCSGYHVGRKDKKLNPIQAKDRERHYKSIRTLLKEAQKIKIPKTHKMESPDCLKSSTGKHKYVKVPSFDNLFCKYCLKDQDE